MRTVVRLIFFALSLATAISLVKTVSASEGTVELAPTTGETYRCFVATIRMQNQEYNINYSCRNLIYPVDGTIFNYIMWATPTEGGNTVKLGALGLGKGEFRTRTTFTNLFVTTESDPDVRSPQGPVVMRGNVQPISFLTEERTQTPTPTSGEAVEEVSEKKAPAQLTTREKLVLAFKRAGIAALLALVMLVGLVFVVTRSRG